MLDGRDTFYASKETVESTRGPWVYDHEFYLILNLALSEPPYIKVPQTVRVAYVRVWKRA